MHTSPFITIVIPTYNAIDLLPQCIESIVKVTGDLLGKSVLVRVQDSLPGDGVDEYINGLSLDGISVNCANDSGIYNAMNKAIGGTTTPWVYFLGADDRLLPGFVEAIAHLEDPNTVYYGDVLYTSDLKAYDGRFSALKLVYRNICHQAMFFPTKILLKYPYLEKYPIKADWASNITLMSKYNFHFIEHNIAIFNNDDGTSANETDVAFDSDKNSIFLSAFGLPYYLLSLTAPLPTTVYRMFSSRRRS